MIIDLDFRLREAYRAGDSNFVRMVTTFRLGLHKAAQERDWSRYNFYAAKLNEHGGRIPLRSIPRLVQEQMTMGMFDKPKYLTGKEGFIDVGDTFWLHNARLDGTTMVGGKEREQVKLLVSAERDSEQLVVYTSGAAIVNAIKRMDSKDRAEMPMELRLDEVPSKQGNPAKVLTPAGQAPPSGGDFSSGADF